MSTEVYEQIQIYCLRGWVESHTEESFAYDVFLPFTGVNEKEKTDFYIEKASLTNFFL